MRWQRLFDELEGHAEHAHTEERDALVADLREGEWAARSWIDGLQDAPAAELEVADVGVLHGRVRLVAGAQSWEGRKGDLLIVPLASHSLEAAEDSAVLLTVAKTGR